MSLAVSMAPADRNTSATGRDSAREIDELTLRRAQRGHDDACRTLVLTYQRPVFALLSRMLGPSRRALVEDLAQDTFLHVFRSLERFAPLGPARLSTWILTIASRRAVDELRKGRPEAEPLADATEPALSEPGADDVLWRRRLVEAIERALADLSPAYRAAFLLREYHGLDYAEIARALDIDLGTVKSRLARARAALRQALAEVRDA